MMAAMEMQHWTTQKKCKCGKLLRVHYEKCGDYEARQLETDGGFFKTTKRWPNYLYCLDCGRRHELAKFKREVKHLPKCGAAECSGCVNCGRGLSNR